jgi:hypothetical protein
MRKRDEKEGRLAVRLANLNISTTFDKAGLS